jgi:hypothetical protein
LIAYHHNDRSGPFEFASDRFNFVRKPHIVLIAQEDYIPGAQGHGSLEVPGDTKPGLISIDPDRKRGAGLKTLQDLQGFVSRAIVGDDQLVRLVRLADKAVQLFLKIPGAVAGRHGNRDETGHSGFCAVKVMNSDR